MPNTTVRAAAEGMPESDQLSDARDRLTRVKDLNELVFMAGESLLTMDRTKANAITAGCDVIASLLNEVCGLLDGAKGGDA